MSPSIPCDCNASNSAKNEGIWITTPEPIIPVHSGLIRPLVHEQKYE